MSFIPDLGPALPEIYLAVFALVILILDLCIKRKETIALVALLLTAVVVYQVIGTSGVTFSGSFSADGYAMFFKLIFLLSLILTILISVKYIAIERSNYGEYYSLLMLATLGMMSMASATDLAVLYLGLELMALSTYVLAGFIRHEKRSNEAAVKYFLLGAFASAILLFGIALLYGQTGTTNLKAIAAYIVEAGISDEPALMLSVVLITVAFAFKIGAAPFHMWVPDVYEGAPTSITAFMSVGPKAAGFAVMGRVFLVAFAPLQLQWVALLIPIAIVTMAVGNLVALAQTNIKRMLAYSSIAHAGYALLGIIAGGSEGLSSMMSYLFIYALMNIGAFSIVILLRTKGFAGVEISDYEGLSKSHPGYAALMLIFMFSLTGIPPMAGFIGKFYLFTAVIDAGYTWLTVVAVMFSAISAFFYLRIVIYMYMREPKGEIAVASSPALNLALTLTAVGVVVIGVLPGKLIELAKMAISLGWS